jgi:hypothetical protein
MATPSETAWVVPQRGNLPRLPPEDMGSANPAAKSGRKH